MRPMFLLGLSVVLVVGLVAGIGSSESPSVGLEGTWVLKCYGEPGKLRVPYPWSHITLIISACATAEQEIGDYPARDYVISTCISTCAGINRCSGNCEVDGNKFITYYVMGEEKHIGSLLCTEAAGYARPMAQERRYLDILTSAQTYEITNGRLFISSGEEVLVFRWKGITSGNVVSSAGT
jgi:hypothetical protein